MKKYSGFTLIELLVTLAVIAILVLVGTPMVASILGSNKTVANYNKVAGSLALARSEAIKRGATISICGSTDGATCDTSNWEDGWIVFVDFDKNLAVDAGDGDTILRIGEALGDGYTLRLSQSDVATSLQYRTDGTLRDRDADGFDSGTFTLCDKDGTVTKARAINVNIIGRPGKATDTNSNNTVEDITGADVTCP